MGLIIFSASVKKIPNRGFGHLALLGLISAVIPGMMRSLSSGENWMGNDGWQAAGTVGAGYITFGLYIPSYIFLHTTSLVKSSQVN